MNSRRLPLPFIAFVALACEGPFVPPPLPPPPPPSVASVALAPDSATVVAGDTLPLTVTLRDSAGTVLVGRRVSWRTADSAIATVDGAGVVLAVGFGSTTVSAASGSHADSVTVFVTPISYDAISAGAVHGCAVANNQRVYCWGDNTRGQTGTSLSILQEPTPRAIATATRFAAVAGGGDHTCAVTAAGEAWCWGDDDYGQAGFSAAGIVLPGPVTTTLRFTALAAGESHSCAIATDRRTYCWGVNAAGQVGNGSMSPGSPLAAVQSDTGFVAITAGGNHSCALTAAGAAFCWGAGRHGELGDSGRSDRSSPVPVSGGLTFSRVGAGGSHTCGVTAGGAGYCWGANVAGQLGTGAADSLEPTPQPVAGGLSFRLIAAGATHSCGLTTDSLAYCWGDDSSGELGDSATTTQPVAAPVAVRGGHRFADLRAGASFSCGITGTLVVYCWGLGIQGQLGQVFPRSSAVPLQITGQP